MMMKVTTMRIVIRDLVVPPVHDNWVDCLPLVRQRLEVDT